MASMQMERIDVRAEEAGRKGKKKSAHWEDAERRKRKAKKQKQRKGKKHAEFQMARLRGGRKHC